MLKQNYANAQELFIVFRYCRQYNVTIVLSLIGSQMYFLNTIQFH